MKKYAMDKIMNRCFRLSVLLLLLVSSMTVNGQDQKVIEGYVFAAENNSPMEGIKVSAKHIKVKSASTDENGFFKLEVKEPGKTSTLMLIFSYPGYQVKEQYGTVGETMQVHLSRIGDYTADQAVYFPYDVKKQRVLTSAVENVDFSNSSQVLSSNFEQLLDHSSARIISASGAPGEGNVINIRGYSSIFAEAKPLVVIDGQVLGNYRFEETSIDGYFHDPLINIDPRNIEAITILKDAPSAALYGASASNGVILIKTKEAKVGKTEFDINSHYGTNYMNKRIPVIKSSDYIKPYLLEQMYSNGFFMFEDYFIEDPEFNQYYRYNNVSDWQETTFGMGNSAGVNINVRGGDAIAKYFLSGGYLHDEGSVDNTHYNRFNARFNADIDMAEWLTATANMGVTYSNGKLMQQGLSYANPVLTSLVKSPFLAPFLIDSNNVELPLTEDADILGFSNPYEIINSSEVNLSAYNFMGTINFNVQITDHLQGNVRGSSEMNKLNENVFIPNHGFFNNDYPDLNQVRKGISSFSRLSTEFNLVYRNTFSGVHNLSGTGGVRTYSDEIIQDIGTGVGTPSDEFKDLGTTLDDGRTKSGYQFFRKGFNSFLSASYNFREQLFVDLTFSADASSNMGMEATPRINGMPVAFSPAIGLGWDLSRPMGLSYTAFLNYFKVRISGGQMANTSYDPYISKNFYLPRQYYTATGYIKPILENEALQWEKTNKVNLGSDMSFARQKLFVTLDVYYHNTQDLLNSFNKNVTFGNEYWDNEGQVNTLGSELSVRLRAYDSKVFKWHTELRMAQYTSVIAGMDRDLIYDFGAGQKLFSNRQPAGAFYGYEVVGVIASAEDAEQLNLSHSNGSKFKAGDIQFRDQDDNNIIDDVDKVVIGNPAPDFFGGWVNKITLGQFSLVTDISFVVGNDIYNHTRRELESMSGFENQSTATLRRWQIDGQETDMPTAVWGDPMGNSRFSERWIEDGSYIRLKRVTLQVDLKKWLKTSNNSELYITGINLLTLDNYLGYDPEFAYGSSILWEGIDYCKFPQNRSVMVGVKFRL
ncbi:MAG: SusC/RagA family TonB-linked outer membrane protein [Bacteroidales bacterium]|nr:SusC/RagA family TonB-linked outer membrane protein [Bacteroidales bacterium]